MLTAVSEIFGNLITIPAIPRFGLKKTAIIFNIIAGSLMLTTLGMLEIGSTRFVKESCKNLDILRTSPTITKTFNSGDLHMGFSSSSYQTIGLGSVKMVCFLFF